MKLINRPVALSLSKIPAFLVLVMLAVIVHAEPSDKKSPFLGDYSSFKKDKEDKNMFVYRDKTKKVADYKKFIVDPVLIFPSEFRRGKPFTAEEQKMLSDLLRSQLLKELEGYSVAETPGPDTARMRFAIRDMKLGNYYVDRNGGTQTITPDMQLAAASFEMEVIDSFTGERILALVRWLQSDDVKGADRSARLKTISQVFADWVRSLRERLDQSSIPE